MLEVIQKKIEGALVLEPLFGSMSHIWLILPRFSMADLLQKALRMQKTIQKARQWIELMEILNQSDTNTHRVEK